MRLELNDSENTDKRHSRKIIRSLSEFRFELESSDYYRMLERYNFDVESAFPWRTERGTGRSWSHVIRYVIDTIFREVGARTGTGVKIREGFGSRRLRGFRIP